jgi:TatD DNase family protein
MYCSVWIHPTDTIEYRDDRNWTIKQLENYYLNNKEKVVAIWECWLDYYWIDSLKEQNNLSEEEIKQIQKDFFIDQIELARKYSLPIIIHNRDSKEDILDILKISWYKNFIFHCYSEDLEYWKKLIEFSPNCKISFSGIVTFKNGKQIAETAQNIPLKNILVETDSPYLTPDPLRWKEENEPSFTKYVLDRIISLREETPEEIKKQIFENSIHTFSI